MRSPYLIFAFLIMLFLLGCKEEKTQPYSYEGQTQKVKEIEELTDAGEIEDLLEEIEENQLKLYKKAVIISFYEENDFEPVWTSTDLRKTLFRNIENIEEEGLFFEDYHGDKLQKLLRRVNSNSEEDNTLLEILLTDSFFRLSEDLATGKLDPNKIYDIWGTPLNEINSGELLKNVIATGNLQQILDSLKPEHIVYQGLKKALRDFKKTDWRNAYATRIEPGKLIRPGEKDERILSVTKRLRDLGYYKEEIDTLNTVYNEKIQSALKEFQLDHDLQIDGLLGNTTITNLNYTKEDRLHQILVNLERWRWYPRELGDHYIIINIPNYELSVVKNGDTLRSHKTMVGTQVRKTPVFSDVVKYIIYNPTWTIPPTIKKNDVIPGASRDISYLRKKNINIYDNDGKLVSPEDVNWSSSRALGYTYRQPAGPSNPLGVAKIIYPNEYMIYLHDTPSKKLFENNARAQSSGCVRVQDALGLAEYLISDQKKYDTKKISEILASGRTTEIPVTQKVKVHHFYWTAFQKKDTTKFIDDIYNLDQNLWELLKPGA